MEKANLLKKKFFKKGSNIKFPENNNGNLPLREVKGHQVKSFCLIPGT